jgi:gamma-glutamyltranspeptidase
VKKVGGFKVCFQMGGSTCAATAREIAAEAEKLAAFPATAAVFLKPDGQSPLLEGDICKNTQLAKTLRRVALEGPGILREGPLAESLAADIGAAGGIVTAVDLAQYRPRIVAPLRASAMGFTLLGVPPPSSGGAAVAQVLEFLGRGCLTPLSPPGCRIRIGLVTTGPYITSLLAKFGVFDAHVTE